MNTADYSSLTVDDLVGQFANACLDQYETYITDDLEKFKRNYLLLESIINELTVRGSGARRSLTRLLRHSNRQVRLQAAKFVYPVAREEAKKCLQDLATVRFPDDQSLSAGMCLDRLEEDPSCLDY